MSYDVACLWQNAATLLCATRTQEMFLKIFRNIFCIQDIKFVHVAKKVNIWETRSPQQCCHHNKCPCFAGPLQVFQQSKKDFEGGHCWRLSIPNCHFISRPAMDTVILYSTCPYWSMFTLVRSGGPVVPIGLISASSCSEEQAVICGAHSTRLNFLDNYMDIVYVCTL